MISARIIADSISPMGCRITTFVLVFPRIVLAEFNTHRMLSRNSASSRAIPFQKMVKMVKENPFIPIKWMKDHTGMQGNVYFEDEEAINDLKYNWLAARDSAVSFALHLNELGLTKQVVNRLLEPFMWHTVIITATEFENFFALRAHPAAEIHIADLADKMLTAYNESNPKQLKEGEWHIPFGDNINLPSPIPIDAGFTLDEGVAIRKVKIATARCARVSYMNFEGKDDYEADIKLHDILASSGHWSPFEHCAKCMNEDEYYERGIFKDLPSIVIADEYIMIETNRDPDSKDFGWSGNFRGFIQYRKMFENENKKDNRVIKK